MKNSYDRNDSINIKEYYKKELKFFVHTEARCWYRKICPCFCEVTVFCYWYNFSNLGRRAPYQFCRHHGQEKFQFPLVTLYYFFKNGINLNCNRAPI